MTDGLCLLLFPSTCTIIKVLHGVRFNIYLLTPGLYPMKAIRTASDLMMGRRVKLILRLVALALTLALMWVIVMLPLILFDLMMKQFEWTAGVPFVPICFAAMTCFTYIYGAAYLYLYYRWMLKA